MCNNLCLENPEFVSVPLVLQSSGHLLLSLVISSKTLDQFTVMIDFQSFSSTIGTDVQKRDEQTMGSMQPKNQVADRRAEPDEERTADSSVVTCGRDPSDDFAVPLDDPNEEITEQWQDDLHDWYICRDDCSVEPARILQEAKPPQILSVSQSRASSLPAQTARYRRHVNVTPTVPQETLVSCFHRNHQLLPGSNAVSVFFFIKPNAV